VEGKEFELGESCKLSHWNNPPPGELIDVGAQKKNFTKTAERMRIMCQGRWREKVEMG